MFYFRNFIRLFLVAGIFGGAMTGNALAQSATADLGGIVVDEQGAAVAGANVSVQRGAVVFRRTQTDQDGRFIFSGLVSESVGLSFRATGFSHFTKDVAAENFGTELQIVLKVRAIGETVEVLDRPAAIYGASESSVATKTATPILEIPQSVQTVNEQLIDNRRPVTLVEALYNVSGVSVFGTPAIDHPAIRGIESANSNIYLDGLRVERGGHTVQQEIYGLERIEVLKGPGSVLFGQGPAGGIISQISKRPLAETRGSVELTYGRFNFVQPTIDLNGPLNRERTVNYRLNLIYRNDDGFADFVGRRRFYVSPALGVKIGERTQLTLLSNYTRDRYEGVTTGIPAEGSVLPNPNGRISPSLYVGEPNRDGIEIDRIQVGYLFEHRFGRNLSLRQALRYTDTNANQRFTFRTGMPSADPNFINRFAFGIEGAEGALAVDTNAEAVFRTGAVRHTLVFGFDYFIQNVDRTFSFGFPGPLNVYQPVYNQPQPPDFAFLNFKRRDQLMGFYMQDQIKFVDRLILTVGGRIDTTDTRNLNLGNNLTTTQKVTSATPRLGLTYLITDGVSAYASYSRSFEPQFGTTAAGVQYEPERGEQFEGGLKTAALGGRLISTFAVFNLRRENVLTADIASPGFSVPTGEQRSRGFEADAAYRILPNWNLTGAYSFIDTEITRDATIPIGNRPRSIPRNQASLWSYYQIDRGLLSGLNVGVGLRYVGTREGTLPNTYKVPDYAIADAALIYRRERLRLQLNVFNLLNKKDYYVAAAPPGFNSVYTGEPINVRATVGYQW